MRREISRSHLLYPGLLGLALMLFFVPESQVGNLRARALSALGPVLRHFSEFHGRNGPFVASVSVQTPAEAGPAAPPPPANQAEEVDRLRDLAARLLNENNRLRSLNPGQGAPMKLPAGISASVIARKTLWQEPMLALDRGEADGVRLHAGVLHRGAVLGRIVSVAPHASCMALLTHHGVSIAARLSESRQEGKLQGVRDEQDARLCRLFVVGKDIQVKPGENIVTSGLDGSFPPGLWLGAVSGVRKTADFQWEISMRPACDENAVEVVHVITAPALDVPWPAESARPRGAARAPRR